MIHDPWTMEHGPFEIQSCGGPGGRPRVARSLLQSRIEDPAKKGSKCMAFWNKDDKNPTVTDEQILNVLKRVQDPDLRKDIVSLGFIRNLKIETGKVSFDLNLTTPACPVKDKMRDEAVALVKSLPGVEAVDVRM